jgi:hypothetical protein
MDDGCALARTCRAVRCMHAESCADTDTERTLFSTTVPPYVLRKDGSCWLCCDLRSTCSGKDPRQLGQTAVPPSWRSQIAFDANESSADMPSMRLASANATPRNTATHFQQHGDDVCNLRRGAALSDGQRGSFLPASRRIGAAYYCRPANDRRSGPLLSSPLRRLPASPV